MPMPLLITPEISTLRKQRLVARVHTKERLRVAEAGTGGVEGAGQGGGLVSNLLRWVGLSHKSGTKSPGWRGFKAALL